MGPNFERAIPQKTRFRLMQMILFNDAEGQVEGVKGEKLNKAYTSIVGFVFEKTFLK
jgi:hypothetical protein